MVVFPLAAAFAMPLVFTEATLVFDEDHSTVAVMSLLVPSEYEPFAENCWPDPA